MNKHKMIVLLIFAFTSCFALGWGYLRAKAAEGIELDYRVVYTGARCLIRGCDPYNPVEVFKEYVAERGNVLPHTSSGYPQNYLAVQQLYPPSAELFFVPFALFAWPVAYLLWVTLTLTLLSLAAFLVWNAGVRYAHSPPFYLSCILLANSGILLAGGNPAGVAVASCIIGAWCVVEQRFLATGVLCLAISLAVKPHDTAFVWLYLLLLGGVFRKRALQALTIFAALAMTAILWVQRIAPNWMQELHSNILAYSSSGSENDPAGGTATMMVNLQPVLAFFRNESHFYNLAVFAICAPLFLFWIIVTLRSRRTAEQIWLGMAAIASLTLLPLYHRPHDAKILLLTLPGCSVLLAQGGLLAWGALFFTTVGILVTSDLPIAALSTLAPSFPTGGSFGSEVLFLMMGRPAGFVLLGVCCFYLWAFSRAVMSTRATAEPDRSGA